MIKLWVQFERGRDDVVGPTLGPFDWVQVTYRGLRVAPDGEHIAMMGVDDDWFLAPEREEIGNGWLTVGPDENSEPFSDFVVFTKLEEPHADNHP